VLASAARSRAIGPREASGALPQSRPAPRDTRSENAV